MSDFKAAIEKERPQIVDDIQKLADQYAETDRQINDIWLAAWNHLGAGVKPQNVVEGVAFDLKSGLMQKYW